MAEVVGTEAVDRPAGLTGLDGYPHQWAGAFPTTMLELDQRGSARQAGAFAAALAELVLTVKRESQQSEDRGLLVIAEAAAAIIPGAEQSSVSVADGPGRLVLRAAHGPLPPQVMALQNETGQGPCLETVAAGAPVRLVDTAEESRWPLFTPRVAGLGVNSMLCTPLAAQNVVFGSLSLMSASPGAFHEEAEILAAVFAAHAALALTGVKDTRELTAMARTRDVIGQAKGILMERHHITADAAFAVLVSASQNSNRKLKEICEEIALTGETSDAQAS